MDLSLVKSGIRLAQILWVLLITALIGNVIATTINASGSATAAINFSMFVAVLCWIASLYGLVAIRVDALARPLVQVPLDGLATLFAFIAAVVLSAKLRAVNCGNLDHDDLPKNYIAWGSANDEKRCREIQASAVFFWFLLVALAASLFFTIKDSRRGFASSRFSSSRPSMAQVGV